MMYVHMTFSKKPLHSTHSTHSTYLFKIFFSLLTLSTAFLQKASGPGKNMNTYCHYVGIKVPGKSHLYNVYPCYNSQVVARTSADHKPIPYVGFSYHGKMTAVKQTGEVYINGVFRNCG